MADLLTIIGRTVLCGWLLASSQTVAQREGGLSEWNRFRGPNGTGLGQGSYPAAVGPEQGVIWKRPFAQGHSSPVFSSEVMFLTGVEGEKLFGELDVGDLSIFCSLTYPRQIDVDTTVSLDGESIQLLP